MSTASPDAVEAGLQKIQDIAASSARAAGADAAKAEQLQSGIEPVWEKIESAVKANDSAAYVALENNFTLLKIAAKGSDSAKASSAAESLSATAKDYLAKHPGKANAGNGEAGSRTAAAVDPAAGTASPDDLPRTGSGDLSVLAGLALCLGGLGLLGGARRKLSPAR